MPHLERLKFLRERSGSLTHRDSLDETLEGVELARIPSQGALRSIQNEYERSGAEKFAARGSSAVPNKRKGYATTGGFGDRVAETLRSLQERNHYDYHTSVPAAVHGAPQTVEETKEVFERLRRMGNFETQDFDATENDLERATNLDREHWDYYMEESWRWAIAAGIGMSMGFCAFCVDLALEILNSWKFSSVKQAIDSAGGFWAPYVAFLFFTMGFSCLSGCIVSFAAPLAAGSGIPEIKSYLNGVRIKGLLSLKTLVCKLASLVLSMAGGLIAGKEGPFIHSGGIVGGGWAGMGSLTLTKLFKGEKVFKTSRKFGGYFRNEADHRDFVSIGTAAGVSTAFAAPIGGLLLAIEEGASFLNLGIFWRGFLATGSGVLTLHFLAQLQEDFGGSLKAKFGIRRDLGLYDDNVALYGKRYYYYIWELPIFALMGIAAGMMGALFVRIHVICSRLRARFVPATSPRRRLLEVVTVAWLTATVFFLLTYWSPCLKLPSKAQLVFYESSGEDQAIYAGIRGADKRGLRHFPQLCKDLVENARARLLESGFHDSANILAQRAEVSGRCKEDEFNTNGQLFFQPLLQSLRIIIHFGETLPDSMADSYMLSSGLLFLWGFVIFILMLATFGIGAATGIFLPSLGVGAAWGRLLGILIQNVVNRLGLDIKMSLPAYAIVGAASMLGGSTRMLISITVLAMEGSGSMQMIVPLMIAVTMAKMVGDSITLPIYDMQIKIRGAPVLTEYGSETHQRMTADKISVGELATTQLVALPPVPLCSELVETLQRCTHEALPVTNEVGKAFRSDSAFQLDGVVTRSQLLRLLKHRIGFFFHKQGAKLPSSKSSIPATQVERYKLLEKLEPLPLKVRNSEQAEILAGLSASELRMRVNLRPFMQRTPFVIQGNASLARTYRLFRTMGLHHLMVGPAKPHVVGIITRKDVTEEVAEVLLGKKANRGIIPQVPVRTESPLLPAFNQPFEEDRASAGDGSSTAHSPRRDQEDMMAEIPLNALDHTPLI